MYYNDDCEKKLRELRNLLSPLFVYFELLRKHKNCRNNLTKDPNFNCELEKHCSIKKSRDLLRKLIQNNIIDDILKILNKNINENNLDKPMNKSMLETGMIIEFKDGSLANVFLNSINGNIISTCSFNEKKEFIKLESLPLNFKDWKREVKKVYRPKYIQFMVNPKFKDTWKVIWENN